MSGEILVSSRPASIVRLVVAYLAGSVRSVATIIGLALVLAASAVIPPYVVAKVIDSAIDGTIDARAVVIAGCGIVVLSASDALLTLIRRRLVVASEVRLRAGQALEHFRIAVRLPMSAYQESNHAALIRSFDDLDGVVDVVAGTSTDFFASATIILSYAVLMLVVQPHLSIVLFLLAILALATSIVTTAWSRSAHEKWLPQRDSRFAFVVECLTSMMAIKTLGAHQDVTRAFLGWQAKEDHAMATYRRRLAIADAANKFWMIAIPGLIATAGVLFMINGQLSVGALVLFLSVSGGLIGSLTALHGQIERYQQAVAALARMQAALRVEPEPIDGGDGRPLTPIKGTIEAIDLRFRHGPTQPDALGRISFRIPAGEHVAVIGLSGRGKTTLASLLVRHHQPTGGDIRIDEMAIASTGIDAYRRQVLLVPHVINVFSASVRDNITLWNETIDDAQIWQALESAHLADSVRKFDNGLDTIIGDRGNPLSAGQKQRLGLARIFARNPNVLILDEATSAIDEATEGLIIQNIRRMMQGRTLVVITHRAQIAKSLDRIIEL